MDINQLKQIFINESNQLLTKLDNTLLELEENPGDPNLIDEAFRAMHTIKGSSGMYGYDKITEVTHELETLFDLVRNNQMNVTKSLIELTFATCDHIRRLLDDETADTEECATNHTTILQSIAQLKGDTDLIAINSDIKVENSTHEKEGVNKVSTWNILFYPDEEIVLRCINLMYVFQDLFELGDYRINHHPFGSEDNPYWSIFLITKESYEEIENVLLFVMDYCKVTKIADFNIFNTEAFLKRQEYEDSLALKSAEETSADNFKDDKIIDNLKNIKSSTKQQNISSTHVNVDATKLDTLMYLVSELVTTKSELVLSIENDDREKQRNAVEKIENLSKLFSENALDLRLVSLNEMLNRFKRLIRDVSKELNKEIEFVIKGEDTELDKSIIDVIREPVLHLLRNCVDHGIEIPEERIENGKTAEGTIRFEAVKTGNNVHIYISDDGKGIDPKMIYNKAVEKGFIAAGTELTEKEIYDLIFLPGFSTAKSLNNISGRGVGMDIVHKKIQEIRGEIAISSSINQGTLFSIKLQQTISILNTLLVVSNDTTFAIPIEDIESCILESTNNLYESRSNLIEYETSLIPFFRLDSLWTESNKVLTRDNEKLIVINKQNKKFAVVVDSIVGEFQAVTKGMGEVFNDIPFISGASLLGDGSIALLLDVDKFFNEDSMNNISQN